MKNIKEILRLASTGSFSARQIAKSCGCSPSTVTAVLERANNAELEKEIFPCTRFIKLVKKHLLTGLVLQ